MIRPLTGPAIFPKLRLRLAALFAVGLLLMLCVLGASPELHNWLHPDGGDGDHECAITLFAHGVELAATVTFSLFVGLCLERVLRLPRHPWVPAPAHGHPPSQAPPLAFL